MLGLLPHLHRVRGLPRALSLPRKLRATFVLGPGARRARCALRNVHEIKSRVIPGLAAH